MATKTEICNQALVLIGAATISDFTTDTRQPAQLCRLYYDGSVEELLEMYPWTFATGRRTLSTPMQDAPVFGFTNAFELPDDYLDITETDLLDSEWRVEGRTIVTDAASISIVYKVRVTDTSKFTPLFRQTLIYLMAAKLAIPLTRSRETAKLYFGLVEQTVSRSENANSHPNNQRLETDALVAVRR